MLMCGCLAASQTTVLASPDPAALPKTQIESPGTTYEPPEVLTATIYPADGTSNRPLFRFKRTSTRSGSEVHVLREYSYPDGKVAVREHVVYQDGELAFYRLDELQTGAIGTAQIEHGQSKGEKGRIVFQYTKDAARHPGFARRTESLVADTVVNDSVGMFLAAHYDRLLGGETVPCHCIVVPHKETIGFTFKKESEGLWHGKEVIHLKMEPASVFIATVVAPLHFVVERAPPHRVLQYTGRTTPKLGGPGHWSDLDALTVLDW
jgi:hypothetical protein